MSKVVVASGDVRIEVEGEEAFVDKEVTRLLHLLIGEGEPTKDSGARGKGKKEKGTEPDATSQDSGGSQPARYTAKSYFKAKAPGNVYEAIALALDFARKYEDKPELSVEEVRQRLIQGGHRPAGSMNQAMTDCRRKYGYVEAGSKRGLWRLSNQGETVVELDLPRKQQEG